MKSKIKNTPRPLLSCGFFRHCTQTLHSPTSSTPPPPPLTHSQLPPPSPSPSLPPPPPKPESSSSSSSSSTNSQSFTQWKFSLPIPTSPISRNPHPIHPPDLTHENNGSNFESSVPILAANLEEMFHLAELHFTSGSGQDRLRALQLMEMSLVANPRAAVDGGAAVVCPAVVMRGVVECLKERVGAKPASKVLFALCLVEANRQVGVEVGVAGALVEALADLEGAVAERALAVLELLCTVAEGAEEVRTHALTVPMMVQVMGKMEGRGKEYAISVLAVIYGGSGERGGLAPPEEVARAVMLALQGDCSARGKRKGAQLLKILQDNGRLDLTQD